jgi:hypothetical protein
MFGSAIRQRVVLVVSVFAGMFHVMAEVGAAQGDTIRIPFKLACAECSVEVKKVATIGTASDPVLLARIFALERDSEGRIYAMSHSRDQIVVFGANGAYLRAVGQAGGGPGEFSSGIRKFSVVSDTLYVLDGSGNVIVFAASPPRFLRRFRIPGSTVMSFMAQPGGSVVYSARVNTGASLGFPFHKWDAGSVASFGSGTRDTGSASRSTPMALAMSTYRLFEPASDFQSLFTISGYTIDEWTVAGARKNVFKVEGAPWFTPEPTAVTVRGRTATEPPRTVTANALISGASSDSLLWVLRLLPRDAPTPEGFAYTYAIDVINLPRRQVLASQHVEEGLKLFPGMNSAFAIHFDSDDLVSFSVWQVMLTQR